MGIAEKAVLVICWLATILCCAATALVLWDAINADAAPAQAAAAAVACGLAIIPYVFTRALEGIFTPRRKPEV